MTPMHFGRLGKENGPLFSLTAPIHMISGCINYTNHLTLITEGRVFTGSMNNYTICLFNQ